MNKAMIGVAMLLLGVGAGLLYVSKNRAAPPPEVPAATGEHNAGADGAFCGKHQLAEADCPWCDTSLIEKLGHCGGHDVPEALCSRCNASLIPGFKAEGDWCAGHDLPESQCAKCKSGDLPPRGATGPRGIQVTAGRRQRRSS